MVQVISVCVLVVLGVVLTTDAVDFSGRRTKRDDGSYFKDSGGPVAQCSKGECNKKSEFGAAGEASAKLDPCEINASKGGKKKKGGRNNASKKKKVKPQDAIGMAKGAVKGAAKGNKGGDGNGPHKPDDREIREEFDKFTKKHGKNYANPAEQAKALKAFGENLTKMYKMNFERRSVYDAAFMITPHADLSLMDFLLKMGGAMPDIDFTPQPIDITKLLKKRNCKQVHWQKFGVVPDVRLQENCGCCYAHSAADLVATQYHIDRKEWDQSTQLSSQYFADCTPEPKAYKCKGGRPCDMLNYIAKCDDCHIPDESCYPYKDAEGNCQSKSAECDSAPKVKPKWAYSVDISGPGEKDLMAALLQHGPVLAVVGVTEGWQMYNGSGILKFGQCTMQQMHAVLITGYNYTSCVPTYWIKNSWGDDWGGRGSIKLEAGKNTCSVAKTVIAVCTGDDCPTNKAEYLNYIISKSNYPDCQD